MQSIFQNVVEIHGTDGDDIIHVMINICSYPNITAMTSHDNVMSIDHDVTHMSSSSHVHIAMYERTDS